MMKKIFTMSVAWMLGATVLLASTKENRALLSKDSNKQVSEVRWDKHSLIIDGKRVAAVMGEAHYSRIPADEWKSEIHKMKEGGITLIATYVFWSHVEEEEGIFDWSGQRNLRRFIELCGEEGLPVVIRIGPFCHGEVRNGGIPDWMFTKGCKMRQPNATFMHYVAALYRQIYSQIVGLQWKDGGRVIACQFDNEYRGSGDYLMALKRTAVEIGFDLPFYTRTGWPELSKPVPFGEMIPLYGDYADGFWERSIQETAGDYWKAFHFKAFRSSTAIASEQLGQQKEKVTQGDEQYPYFTCELGGGMMTSYHRRVYLYPEDAYSMAVVKLGSGSNLLGYYMYHGGTNPEGKLTNLNEEQRTIATNYNDLPVKTYDFQAPLGEFGQRNPHYYTLRTLHTFMADFGEDLAPMEAYFPQADKLVEKGEDTYLRWTYRAKDGSAFVFINNYERLQNLSDKSDIRFEVEGINFPQRGITIPAGTIAVLPVNLKAGAYRIEYATTQPVARRIVDGVIQLYMMKLDGIHAEICINGKLKKNLKVYGTDKPVIRQEGLEIYLLTPEQAGRLFLPEEATRIPQTLAECTFTKIHNAGTPRTITIGVNKVAESPINKDFEKAAVYKISLPKGMNRSNALLDIDYLGDVARLYADGKLIDDNFWNGRTFQYALWRLPSDCLELELRILPMQKDMPVYFPSAFQTEVEKGKKFGEQINHITIVERK